MVVMEFTSVWDDAGDSAEAADKQYALTVASIACLAFQSFLTAALTEEEYSHREALAADRIERAALNSGVSPEVLAARLREDWRTLAAARKVAINDAEESQASSERWNQTRHDHLPTDEEGDEYQGENYADDDQDPHYGRDAHHASRRPFARSATNEDDGGESDVGAHCPRCGGPGVPLGKLGNRLHFRCRNCGTDFSHAASTSAKAVRRLAIVHVAGENPFAKDDDQDAPPPDGDDAAPPDDDGDQDDVDLSQSNPGAYYVLDEDANLDIGGPYASKADAQDAIEAGVFDSDSPTVQKGTVAENGGGDQDPDAEEDPDADPAADEQSPAEGDDEGNPFAKNSSWVGQPCANCGGPKPDKLDDAYTPICNDCWQKEGYEHGHQQGRTGNRTDTDDLSVYSPSLRDSIRRGIQDGMAHKKEGSAPSGADLRNRAFQHGKETGAYHAERGQVGDPHTQAEHTISSDPAYAGADHSVAKSSFAEGYRHATDREFASRSAAVVNDSCATCGGKITQGVKNDGSKEWTHATLPGDRHKPTPKTAASRLPFA